MASTASRAFGWSFLNTATSRLGTLAIGIALARLLGPEAFGTFAVATVALLAMLSFNELGVSLAIVRWKGDPAAIAPTVTTISVVSSAFLVLLVFFSAPAFSTAMGDPGATDVVRLMSVSILVNGAVATPAAMLQRQFRQGRRMGIDQVNTWLGALISLILAVAGFGAMSLAIGRITGGLVSGVMFVAWSPVPYRFGWDRGAARALLRFGLPLAAASTIVFAVGYADQLTAARFLGATSLGYYVLAFNLSSWPVSVFSQPLRSVAPAALARLQHDPEAMRLAFRSMLGVLAAVALPACFLLAGAADPIIRLVYGKVWAPAAPVLTFLAVLAAARIFFELTYDYLVVRGESRAILFVQVGWLVALVPSLYVGARVGGLAGIAVAQVGVATVVVIPLYALLLRRSGITFSQLAGRVWVSVIASILVGGAALVFGALMDSPLLAGLAAGGVALAVALLLIFRERGTLQTLRRRPGHEAQA